MGILQISTAMNEQHTVATVAAGRRLCAGDFFGLLIDEEEQQPTVPCVKYARYV